MNDEMIMGDGVTISRSSSNGTSFVNQGTAPIARYWDSYQGRAWAGGTSGDLFFSTDGTVTDWLTDSKSLSLVTVKIDSDFKRMSKIETGRTSSCF